MIRPLLAALAALALIATTSAAATAESPAIGNWINPKGSLIVRTAPCGANLCGAIVHATQEAQNDARDAGVNQLIGLQLLQDYRPVDGRTWRGRVYVPDMGRSFSSRIEQPSPDELKITGCLIGSMFCRSQLWHRVK